jgi:hypothetical protein
MWRVFALWVVFVGIGLGIRSNEIKRSGVGVSEELPNRSEVVVVF